MRAPFIVIVALIAGCAAGAPRAPDRARAVRERAGEELGCTPEHVHVSPRRDPSAGSSFVYDVNACASSFERTARKKASRDLGCDELTLRARPDLGVATFDVVGCGTAARYACFEWQTASDIYDVTCRGRVMSKPVAVPATWGGPP